MLSIVFFSFLHVKHMISSAHAYVNAVKMISQIGTALLQEYDRSHTRVKQIRVVKSPQQP